MPAPLLEDSDARRMRWESRTEPWLIGAAVIFLGAYAWPILDQDLDQGLKVACTTATLAIWVLFAVDFLARLALAEQRLRFVRHNWLDVITLVVPMLRPVRALRAVVALNVLARRGLTFTRGRVVLGVATAVGIVGFVAAVAMLDAERANPDANIKGFGDASWWALTTATTVGYGERYPTTTEGRFVAAGLMLMGVALLGVVTAALASWFVDKLSEVRRAEERTDDRVTALVEEVRALRQELGMARGNASERES